MREWESQYENSVRTIKNIKKGGKGVLLGFNVNIDKIIQVTPEKMAGILKKAKILFPTSQDITKIKTVNQLLSSLINAIERGQADERLVVSKDVCTWIEETFEVYKTTIGGQAGIIANFLSSIGVGNILLSLPVKNKTIISKINSGVSITERKGSKCIRLSVDKTKEFDLIGAPHYIFEFKEGRYFINKKTITCNRQNRFIASFDVLNSKLKMGQCFPEFTVNRIDNYGLAIISGFHLIDLQICKKSTYLEALEPVISLIRRWKKKNPELVIHYEFAATKDKKLRKAIFTHVLPYVDSIGLNEQELVANLEILNSNQYNISKKEPALTTFYQGLKTIHEHYKHLRIHFHYPGYFIVVSGPISNKEITVRKNALITAASFAAIKAKFGDITKFSENDISLDNISKQGYDELRMLDSKLTEHHTMSTSLSKQGYCRTQDHTIVAIPSIIIPKPRYLVGLGDIISSSAILFETIS